MGMKIPFNSFVTGEIDESLSARYDLAKYKPACRVMKNFLVELHGNARRRPGTSSVAWSRGCRAPTRCCSPRACSARR